MKRELGDFSILCYNPRMKLISLNTWGGMAGKESLLAFFKKHRDADVICLQEVFDGGEHMASKLVGDKPLERIVYTLLQGVDDILPDHQTYFRPHFGDWYGLAIFIKKDFVVTDEGELYVYKEKGWHHETDHGNIARTIQWITFDTPLGARTVINFHGLWNGRGKSDTADRLEQSDRIIAFLKTLDHPYVLIGDFNLLPDTESLKKFETFGLRNLIREYDITSTRTSHYTKEHRYADYAFVSDGIVVHDFRILPDEVSDHSPLLVEFE